MLLLGGCHGGAQTDIIQREMRWQEDQIYALEDYLAQYQQLLQECRAENESLKRDLAQRGDQLPTPEPSRPSRPAAEAPEPTIPEVEIEVPDIPPLGDATPDGEAALAAVPTPESPPTPEPATHIRLHGAVLPNDSGGPRLLIDVEPLAGRDATATFDGRVSLMVLANGGREPFKSLARWDFSADQVAELASAALEEAAEGALRFRLELPAETPVDEPVELWVRLIDEEGQKLLEHVALDLARPSHFASLRRPSPTADSPSQPVVLRAVHHEPAESRPHARPAPYDGGWTIAQPGEPSGPSYSQGERASEWKAATQPVPQVAAASRSSATAETPEQSAATAYVLPTWSPKR